MPHFCRAVGFVLTAWLLVTVSANRAPTNVNFSVTKTIPHDGNKDTSSVTVELAPVAIDPDGDPMDFHWKCPNAISSHEAHVEVLTAVFRVEPSMKKPEIKEYLSNHPLIKFIWVDWCCMPQGQRTNDQQAEFDRML